MVTLDVLLVPPGPMHVNEKLLGVDKGPVLAVPLGDCAPLHPPPAVQEAALVELHVNTAALPVATAGGLAVSVAVGTTLTAAVAGVLEPPAPLHVNEYDVFTASAAVLAVPLVALAPFQPPVAVQEVAFEEFHVSTAVPPAATEAALVTSVAVGVTLTVTYAGVLTPPAPLQVRE